MPGTVYIIGAMTLIFWAGQGRSMTWEKEG
jgi:hypothetical protein